MAALLVIPTGGAVAVLAEVNVNIEGQCNHPGVLDLLRFEAARLREPIRVLETNLAWGPANRQEGLEVYIHSDSNPTRFQLFHDDTWRKLEAPLWLPTDERPTFGPEMPGGEVQPLVSLAGMRVLLHLPPAALDSAAVHILGPVLEEALQEAAEALGAGRVEQYATLRTRAQKQRLTSLRQDRDVVYDTLRRLEADVRREYRKLSDISAQVRDLDRYTLPALKRQARDEYRQLRQMVPDALASVRIDGEVVVLDTHPIDIDFEGGTYSLGAFEIRLDLHRSDVRIHGRNGQEVSGYPHPHVAGDGRPCLGNMTAVVADMLGRSDVVGLAVGLLQFAKSYNPDNPYVDIRRWDPNWSDDARWDSCYEDVGPQDCVTCDEDNCPHREGASDRCWEVQDSYIACIECGDCSWSREALDNCRADHSPQACFDCHHACTYAGDTDSCFDTHDGEDCPECQHAICPRYPSEDEEGESR